ncbi:unnamed protein product [Owenia fusiformis]|uniref:Peptidase C1A papain C-terminal domain-containing protein n=1 Tax=Owenia fusiformis TaxID=6347 RepID=A0A8S4NQZ4_OWEFU|nr:unnamed protein product [Owenia fusiformis]
MTRGSVKESSKTVRQRERMAEKRDKEESGRCDDKTYTWKCDDAVCMFRASIVDYVNSKDLGWKASYYSKGKGRKKLGSELGLRGKSLAFALKYRLGTRLGTSVLEPYLKKPSITVRISSPSRSINQISQYVFHPHTELKKRSVPDICETRQTGVFRPKETTSMSNSAENETFPDNFTWVGLVSAVHDQGKCGSSWALSTVDVASDRLALHSEGSINVTLSLQQLISCNRKNKGCKGGRMAFAWEYIKKVGLLTEECYGPYISDKKKNRRKCIIKKENLKQDDFNCPSNNLVSGQKYQVFEGKRIPNNEKEIMKEIRTNGPVQATFLVREDFYMYESGIYTYSNLPSHMRSEHGCGYHAVRIVGWGSNEEGKKYWVVANSWGPEWGKNGYFHIKRGVDECGIESDVYGINSAEKKVGIRKPDRLNIERRSDLKNLYKRHPEHTETTP